MSCIRNGLLVLLLLGSSKLNAQDDFALLGETSFALNTELSYKYQMNFGVRTRYFLYQNEDFVFNSRQLDLIHFSTIKLDLRHTVSLGLQYRSRDVFEEGDNEFRLTQQFNIVKQKDATRYGHRFRLEQRFFQLFTTFRFRYRFTFDFPLNGPTLDLGEGYFIQSFEGVSAFSKIFKPSHDLRITSQLGWLLSKYFKLQMGLEYRLESFNSVAFHRLILLTTAVLKL